MDKFILSNQAEFLFGIWGDMSEDADNSVVQRMSPIYGMTGKLVGVTIYVEDLSDASRFIRRNVKDGAVMRWYEDGSEEGLEQERVFVDLTIDENGHISWVAR